jgi:hypothetical protein
MLIVWGAIILSIGGVASATYVKSSRTEMTKIGAQLVLDIKVMSINRLPQDKLFEKLNQQIRLNLHGEKPQNLSLDDLYRCLIYFDAFSGEPAQLGQQLLLDIFEATPEGFARNMADIFLLLETFQVPMTTKDMTALISLTHQSMQHYEKFSHGADGIKAAYRYFYKMLPSLSMHVHVHFLKLFPLFKALSAGPSKADDRILLAGLMADSTSSTWDEVAQELAVDSKLAQAVSSIYYNGEIPAEAVDLLSKSPLKIASITKPLVSLEQTIDMQLFITQGLRLIESNSVREQLELTEIYEQVKANWGDILLLANGETAAQAVRILTLLMTPVPGYIQDALTVTSMQAEFLRHLPLDGKYIYPGMLDEIVMMAENAAYSETNETLIKAVFQFLIGHQDFMSHSSQYRLWTHDSEVLFRWYIKNGLDAELLYGTLESTQMLLRLAPKKHAKEYFEAYLITVANIAQKYMEFVLKPQSSYLKYRPEDSQVRVMLSELVAKMHTLGTIRSKDLNQADVDRIVLKVATDFPGARLSMDDVITRLMADSKQYAKSKILIAKYRAIMLQNQEKDFSIEKTACILALQGKHAPFVKPPSYQ